MVCARLADAVAAMGGDAAYAICEATGLAKTATISALAEPLPDLGCGVAGAGCRVVAKSRMIRKVGACHETFALMPHEHCACSGIRPERRAGA